MSVARETLGRRGVHRLAVSIIAMGGLGVCLLPGVARAQGVFSFPLGCSSTHDRGPADVVTLDVVKNRHIPGFLCVYILNGLPQPIRIDPRQVRLQRRRGGSTRRPRFYDYTTARAFIPGSGLADIFSGKGEVLRLPPETPPAPGIYRVCFRYAVYGQKSVPEICSPEFSLNKGDDIPPPPGCPSLPERTRGRRAAVYVGKRTDTPGLVCVRAINGLQVRINYGANVLWLQKWYETVGKFMGIQEPDSQGTSVLLVSTQLPPGGIIDAQLPSSHRPLAAGRYRVSFRFILPEQSEDTVLYSEEFSVP